MARQGLIVSNCTTDAGNGSIFALTPTVRRHSSTRRTHPTMIAILEFRHRTMTP